MRITALLISSLLFITGCTFKNDHLGEINDRIEKEVINKNKVDKSTNSLIAKTIKERYVKNNCATVGTTKMLSQVLAELSPIDGRIYKLALNHSDMQVPESGYRICRSKDELAYHNFLRYFETMTDKSLYIEKNIYQHDNLPKIIHIVQKNQKKNDILKKPFPKKLIGLGEDDEVNHIDVIRAIAKKYGYTFTKNPDLKEDPIVTGSFKMGFNGKTNGEYFEYLKDEFNVFIDLDYSIKKISSQKYKQLSYQLNIGNVKITHSDTASSSTSSSSSESNGDQVGGANMDITREMDIYASVEEDLKFVKDSSRLIDASLKNDFKLNPNNGNVKVTSDYLTMKDYSSTINRFNLNNKRSVKVTLLKLEVYSSSTDTYGLDFDATLDIGDTVTTITNALTDPVATLKYANGNDTIDAFLNALHQYGHIYKGFHASELLANNFPEKVELKTLDNYISKITKNVTTTDGISTTASTSETDKVDYGTTFTLTPTITGDEVSIQLEYDNKSKPTMNERTVDDETIVVPSNLNNSKIRKMIPHLRVGDVRIVQNITEYIEQKDYKNKLPFDEMLIGGLDDKTSVKRELITAIFIR